MINLYLKRKDFRCKGIEKKICECGFETVDVITVEVITSAAIFFDDKPIITSGCRCLDYNEYVQKEVNANYVPFSSKSQHMKGWAADHKFEKITPKQLYDFYNDKFKNKFGLGLYNTFVHFDPRPWFARW